VPPELMALLRAGMSNDEAARPTAVQLRDALLALDFDLGGTRVFTPGRRPVLGPPSRGPSESISPAWTPMSGWGDRPPAGGGADDDFPGDNEDTQTPPRFAPRPPPASGWRLPGVSDGRPWVWLGLATGFLAVVALVGAIGWQATAGHRAPARPAPKAQVTPSKGDTGPGTVRPSGAGAGAPCGLTGTLPSMRCASTPECFGPITVDSGAARAPVTPCDQPHSWEAYALGTLPAGITTTDYQTIKNDAYVRSACNATTLAMVDFQAYAWHVDMLPPTPDAFRAGDRTFRCVAGPASGTTTGSTFVRPAR
jgi:eukaryotic-like serine/threonine-protein kinase